MFIRTKLKYFIFLFIFSIFLISSILCVKYLYEKSYKKNMKDGISSIAIEVIEKQLKSSKYTSYERSRVETVLNNWKNGTIDPEPSLLYAYLTKYKGDTILYLRISDEDGDIVGLGIKERHQDPNEGITIIKEEYPVYVHFTAPPSFSTELIPVKLRNKKERKNKEQWNQFTKLGLNHQKPMPIIWVSEPIPDKLEVSIWIYDKKGNKSDLIPIVNHLHEDDSKK
ncbi:MAG: hypothetical protein AMJ79_15520 [Phycisphaerae bacterium SM23_30]|nr:MAG: hypothetical protein AMJ79_15520 [Phycisphaerae bacterium SM23_30]